MALSKEQRNAIINGNFTYDNWKKKNKNVVDSVELYRNNQINKTNQNNTNSELNQIVNTKNPIAFNTGNEALDSIATNLANMFTFGLYGATSKASDIALSTMKSQYINEYADKVNPSKMTEQEARNISKNSNTLTGNEFLDNLYKFTMAPVYYGAKFVKDINKSEEDIQKEREAINTLRKNNVNPFFDKDYSNLIKENIENNVNLGVESSIEGIGSAGQALTLPLANNLGLDDLAESSKDLTRKFKQKQEARNQKLYGLQSTNSPALNFGGQVANQVGVQLPTMAINAVAPGAGLATMGVSAGGNKYSEVINDDFSNYGKAALSSTITGATEILTEKMFDANILTKGTKPSGFTRMTNNLLGLIDNPTMRRIASIGADVLGENVEEITSNIVEDITDVVLNDKKYDSIGDYFKEFGDKTWDTLTTTTATTLVLGMLGLGGGTYKNASKQNSINQLINNSDLNEEQRYKIKDFFDYENIETIGDLDQFIKNVITTGEVDTTRDITNNRVTFDTSAIENNLDPNVEINRYIQQLGEKRGLQVVYDNNESQPASYENDNGNRVIRINPNKLRTVEDVNNTLAKLEAHEIYHDLVAGGNAEKVTNMIIDKLQADGKYESELANIKESYEKAIGKEITEELAQEELIANYIQDNIGNEEFIKQLVDNTNKGTFAKLIDTIKDVYSNFKGNVDVTTDTDKFLDKVSRMYEKAYNQEFVKPGENTFKYTNNLSINKKHAIGGINGVNNVTDNEAREIAINNYNEAVKLAENGANNDELLEKTGWFKDKNGDFKFEFPDKDMKLKDLPYKRNVTYKLGDILEHNLLFALYPELRDYNVIFKDIPGKTGGLHNYDTKTIYLDNYKFKDDTEATGTLIHEIQHAIQRIEKFKEYGRNSIYKEAYYSDLGEIEADDTKNRFLLENKGELDRTLTPPESSKTNPEHTKYQSYINDRQTVDKLKDSLYNHLNKLANLGDNNENSKENSKKIQKNQRQNPNDNNLSKKRGIDNRKYSIDRDNQEYNNIIKEIADDIAFEHKNDRIIDIDKESENITQKFNDLFNPSEDYDYSNLVYDIENELEKQGYKQDYQNSDIYRKLDKGYENYDKLIEWLDEQNINYEISKSINSGLFPSIYIKDDENNTIGRIANHDNGKYGKRELFTNADYDDLEKLKEYVRNILQDNNIKYSIDRENLEKFEKNSTNLPKPLENPIFKNYNNNASDDSTKDKSAKNTKDEPSSVTGDGNFMPVKNIDDRTIEDTSNRKVNAMQFDYPEIKPYFKEMAENLLYDLKNTTKAERSANYANGEWIYTGTPRITTNEIAELRDTYKLSYDEIEKALNNIINDKGSENNAKAKKVEFILDQMLKDGYTDINGEKIEPNQDYIDLYNKLSSETPTESTTIENKAILPKEQQTNLPPPNNTTESNIDLPPAENQRRRYKTIIESDYTSEEAKKIAKDLMGKDTYIPDSNEQQLERADNYIERKGVDGTLEYLLGKLENNDRITAEDIALDDRLIQYYSKIGNSEKLQEAIRVGADLGTITGQSLQAFAMMRHQSPNGMAIWIERHVNKLNEKIKDGKPKFDFTAEMKEKITNSTKENLESNVDEVLYELGQQVPKTTSEKLDAWRYLAMLGNPKTHLRNIAGNVAMGLTQRLKSKVAGGIETLAGVEKTHTGFLKGISKENIEFAKKQLQSKDIKILLGMEANKFKENISSQIKENQKNFKSDLLNNTIGKIMDLNDKALTLEDNKGLKSAYTRNLADYMTANNLTEKTITSEQLAKANKFAVDEALRATFHQANNFASMISQWENKNSASKFIIGGLLPFKKTPANIAVTGIEYSPIGLAKSLSTDLVKLKQGKINANEFIDNISKGLTGSAITALAFGLAELGLVTSGGDGDKKDDFETDQRKSKLCT